MKPSSASADIHPMNARKSASRIYLSARKGMSAHLSRRRFRLKSQRPSFQRFSERVPTGHSQEQNAFLSNMLISRKLKNKYMAAGWISGTRPVMNKYFAFISPAMGSQPSIPAGRET